MKKIILASSSKRRIEMMRKKGCEPIIMPADVDETLPFPMPAETAVMYLALKKASFVEEAVKMNITNSAADDNYCSNSDNISDAGDCSQNCLIVGADTVVFFEDRLIGKPRDKKEAFEILSSLRNNCHHVLTGVCVIDIGDMKSLRDFDTKTGFNSDAKTCFYDNTAVYFKNYSDKELTAYINSPEPYDKAGGYAIQETFKKYIDHIEGDFDNVVGFPWYRFEPFIKESNNGK